MKLFIRLALIAISSISLYSHAALIQGPAFITATTAIPTCSAICGGFGSDINQIADGDVSNFNGFAGLDGVVGIISLDLNGDFDLESFTLWNDLNVAFEGVEDFALHFYDDMDNLIESIALLTAGGGLVAGQTFTFASEVANVSRVDFEVLSLLTGGACCRIEVREVAFNGEPASPVPVPAAIWLFMSALVGLRISMRFSASS